MATLPWTPAGSPLASGAEVVVLASRLELRRLRTVPGFLVAAMRIRRQVRRTAGALGVSLVAQPAARTFWTLSAWTDREAIDAFVGTPPHRDIMGRFHDALRDAQFATWTFDAATLPPKHSSAADLWRDAKTRLTTVSTGG